MFGLPEWLSQMWTNFVLWINGWFLTFQSYLDPMPYIRAVAWYVLQMLPLANPLSQGIVASGRQGLMSLGAVWAAADLFIDMDMLAACFAVALAIELALAPTRGWKFFRSFLT